MRIKVVESAENSVDFNFFEEEFQVKLALAISVSDPDSREDPETVQIKDAKQISLGCVPSETLTESLSSVLGNALILFFTLHMAIICMCFGCIYWQI
ncbi:Serine/threonine-protein kinase EDR1 [Camellia lanceoleosa]|uniref:Serine/threonine-protein kinase EDR1 n=1 Tax=Camellia lanceoleosa TaxID=1840588 RepID=A0ACC0H5S7_9ERIC|nr:Serine/threonine-protein kinase EDR1 [Camellia lanceoleosa]